MPEGITPDLPSYTGFSLNISAAGNRCGFTGLSDGEYWPICLKVVPFVRLFLTLRDSGTLERTHKSENRLRSQFMWIGPLRMLEFSRKVRKSHQRGKRPLTPLHDHLILNDMVNDSSEQLNTVFFALADPTRRAILARLTHGEASGTELAQPFSISVPAISKHLRVLEHAELILHRKDGRTHRFRLAARPLKEVATWLEHYRQFWEAQLDSLDTYLQVTSEEEQDPDDPFSIS